MRYKMKNKKENGKTEKKPSGQEQVPPPGKPAIDITELAKKLLQNKTKLPEKLNMLERYHKDHKLVLNGVTGLINESSAILNPPKDLMSQANTPITKLSATDRAFLEVKVKDLKSLRRQLKKQHRKIQNLGKASAKKGGHMIKIDDLRDKVKDPAYYKRYGKFIIPAFERMLKNPMTEEAIKGLIELKETTEDPIFHSLLSKFLLWNNIEVHIKSTGNAELKPKYFDEFRQIILNWDPATAVIKSTNK